MCAPDPKLCAQLCAPALRAHLAYSLGSHLCAAAPTLGAKLGAGAHSLPPTLGPGHLLYPGHLA